MTLITKGMGIILKRKGGSKAMKEAFKPFKESSKTLKKYLDKKKGKELDFDDVKKSYKIFTKKK